MHAEVLLYLSSVLLIFSVYIEKSKFKKIQNQWQQSSFLSLTCIKPLFTFTPSLLLDCKPLGRAVTWFSLSPRNKIYYQPEIRIVSLKIWVTYKGRSTQHNVFLIPHIFSTGPHLCGAYLHLHCPPLWSLSPLPHPCGCTQPELVSDFLCSLLHSCERLSLFPKNLVQPSALLLAARHRQMAGWPAHWRAGAPTDNVNRLWIRKERHDVPGTRGYRQYNPARSHGAFDRRGDIAAHRWNIISHTVQWRFSVLTEGSNDTFYLPAIPFVFMAEMLLFEHIMKSLKQHFRRAFILCSLSLRHFSLPISNFGKGKGKIVG